MLLLLQTQSFNFLPFGRLCHSALLALSFFFQPPHGFAPCQTLCKGHLFSLISSPAFHFLHFLFPFPIFAFLPLSSSKKEIGSFALPDIIFHY